jgi:hypothetical protein
MSVADATLFAGSLGVKCAQLPDEVTWKVEICRGCVVLSMRWEARLRVQQEWTWDFLTRATLGRLDEFAGEAVDRLWAQIRPPGAPALL